MTLWRRPRRFRRLRLARKAARAARPDAVRVSTKPVSKPLCYPVAGGIARVLSADGVRALQAVSRRLVIVRRDFLSMRDELGGSFAVVCRRVAAERCAKLDVDITEAEAAGRSNTVIDKMREEKLRLFSPSAVYNCFICRLVLTCTASDKRMEYRLGDLWTLLLARGYGQGGMLLVFYLIRSLTVLLL